MAGFDSSTQVARAAEWPKYEFNGEGNLFLPGHLESMVRSTLISQIFYTKQMPALTSVEHFIPSFMIELHNRLGKEALVNWVYSSPHYPHPGAPMIEYRILKHAAKDQSLTAREIVALVLTNGRSTTIPQAPAVKVEEPMPDSAVPEADVPTPDFHYVDNAHSNDTTSATASAPSTPRAGWPAAPLCNDGGHLYHDCPRRRCLDVVARATADQDFLLYYRQNKPPIMCRLDFTEVYHERHPLLIALPWTPAFALEQSRLSEGLQGQWHTGTSWEWYEYEWIGNPDLEARHRLKDPAVDDLAKETLAMSGVRWDDPYSP
ncbi:hypothetical protein PG994_000546 [Apiospora phragmitis]|uniref:Uncharacterized protein n=1 Tax=Apiospora phragmitis TaxID=2905665 RepID=A0ABR1X6H2_9PEZI